MAAGSSAAPEFGSDRELTVTRIFDAPRDSNQGGWNSALDCLAEYLATVR